MKKIFVDKEEGIASLVERVISDADAELVLVVPKNSILKESISNFNILKREAEAAGKSILLETVDTEVLALATKAKIENFHPLFQDIARSRSLSDIRIQSGEGGGSVPRRSVDIKLSRGGKAKAKSAEEALPRPAQEVPMPAASPAPEPPEPEDLTERDAEERKHFSEQEERFAGGPSVKVSPAQRFTRMPSMPKMPSVRLGRRGFLVLISIVVLAALGVWVTNGFFGRADIAITFATASWQQDVQMLASKAVSKPSANGNVLPAESLSQTKNTTQFFPASGRAVVSLKAKGRVTIYNAYSSAPQTLVATTRFETPDGKIFRLDKGVTVPGAEVKDGKIIPSSIEADVTADKAGDAYNIGPVPKLVIPGFKGTPRFAGFYGELKEKAQGGATGERPVPTEADIAAAKEKVTEILRSTLQSNFLGNRPEDWKSIDGASDLTITRLTVNQATDEKGQFSVFGEAQYRAIVFRESDLKTALLSLASAGKDGLAFRDLSLSYKNPRPDFAKGELSFTVTANGTVAPAFDVEAFKMQAAGKDIAAARSLISSLPDLQEGKISLWPIWLGAVPDDASRVNVTSN